MDKILNKNLKKRILEISYKNKLSHLGTYFSSVDIIDNIYSQMKDDDIFILSCGHASLALYVVLEKYKNINAEMLFNKHGGHPHRDETNHLFCSTGSLGMGLSVAVGRALANPKKNVFCLISDGESAEGIIWESLQYIYQKNINNIKVYTNVNGYCAYDLVDKQYIIKRYKAFLPSINIIETKVEHFKFLKGINAHYHIMSEKDYLEGMRELE